MRSGSRKRFSELLPQVLITKKQKAGVMTHAEVHARSISDVVRAALDFYLAAHPIGEPDTDNERINIKE
jgi:hypothetical protein